MLMGIDPSLTRTGVGFTDGGRLVHTEGITVSGADSLEKASLICRRLGELQAQHQASEILVELPSNRDYGHGGGASGQAAYGFCAGMVFQYMWMTCPDKQVIPLYTDVWSGHSKAQRRLRVVRKYPTFEALSDSGMDRSDAVAMCMMWEQKWSRDPKFIARYIRSVQIQFAQGDSNHV